MLRRTPFLVALLGLLVASAAHAEDREGDSPWTPKNYPTSRLLESGNYDESPLELPWDVRKRDRVSNHGRLDFEFHLDATFEEVDDHFSEAYEKQTAALELKPSAVVEGTDRELTVAGVSTSDPWRRYSLDHDPSRRTFDIKLREGEDGAILLLQNAAITRIFGKGFSERAPFKPVDADPLPFDVR